MGSFINGSDMGFRFHSCIEHDFFVRALGYNDFDYIAPDKGTRRQSFYTIHVVLSGSGVLRLAGTEFEVKEHSIFCVPPDTDLMYYPNDNDKWEYMWFEFVGGNSSQYMQAMGLSLENPVMPCRDFQTIKLAAQSIFSRPNVEETVKYYDVLSLFYKVVASASQRAVSNRQTTVEAVISYIVYHYHYQNLTVENICRDLHISHSHLCRLLKNATGKTPIGYLLGVRLDEACRLLKHTDMHISEIAYTVGFKDAVHFMKTFKNHMNCTPKEYRKINQKI